MGQAYTAKGTMPPKHSSTTLNAASMLHSASSFVAFLMGTRTSFSRLLPMISQGVKKCKWYSLQNNSEKCKKSVDKFREMRIIVFVRQNIAGLCNGSTADSDSVCEGSNPSPAARKPSVKPPKAFSQHCNRRYSGEREQPHDIWECVDPIHARLGQKPAKPCGTGDSGFSSGCRKRHKSGFDHRNDHR